MVFSPIASISCSRRRHARDIHNRAGLKLGIELARRMAVRQVCAQQLFVDYVAPVSRSLSRAALPCALSSRFLPSARVSFSEKCVSSCFALAHRMFTSLARRSDYLRALSEESLDWSLAARRLRRVRAAKVVGVALDFAADERDADHLDVFVFTPSQPRLRRHRRRARARRNTGCAFPTATPTPTVRMAT